MLIFYAHTFMNLIEFRKESLLEKVQVGNYQKKVQSERNSHSKNQSGKTLN